MSFKLFACVFWSQGTFTRRRNKYLLLFTTAVRQWVAECSHSRALTCTGGRSSFANMSMQNISSWNSNTRVSYNNFYELTSDSEKILILVVSGIWIGDFFFLFTVATRLFRRVQLIFLWQYKGLWDAFKCELVLYKWKKKSSWLIGWMSVLKKQMFHQHHELSDTICHRTTRVSRQHIKLWQASRCKHHNATI